MKTKFLLCLSIFLFTFFSPLGLVLASDAYPTPEPGGRITAPGITGVNPDPEPEDGIIGEIETGLGVQQVVGSVPLSSESPPSRDLRQSVTLPTSLRIPLRLQSTDDVSCGVQALGMAIDFLATKANDGEAPSSQALMDNLARSGLLYEWGTGVEELAYLARQHGFQGSYAFHNWSLDKLQEQLQLGNPVVVSMGTNGEGKPGHFVTVTGVSEAAGLVSYNDPALGQKTVSVDQFMTQWSKQGHSGMVTKKGALKANRDPMLPVMAVFSALSALSVSYSNISRQQKSLANFLSVLSKPSGGGKRVKSRKKRSSKGPRSGKLRGKWPTEGQPSEHNYAQPVQGLTTWRTQVRPTPGKQKRDLNLLKRRRSEFVLAEKRSQEMIANARKTGQKKVAQAQNALAQARVRATLIEKQARQQGDRMTAPAQRDVSQAKREAAAMLAQARRQGDGWVRAEHLKLTRARNTANSWLRHAEQRARGWVQAAYNGLSRARSRASSWLRHAEQRGRRWVQAAYHGLNRARSRASSWLRHAKQRGRGWVQAAYNGLNRARSRASSWLRHAEQRGRGWVQAAYNGLNRARSRASSWLRHAKQRGRRWVQAAYNSLNRARNTARYYANWARRRGGRWVRWARDYGRRIIANAQRTVSSARHRARSYRAYWQKLGNRQISGAQRDVIGARHRARNYRAYWQRLGNQQISGAQRDVSSAQRRARNYRNYWYRRGNAQIVGAQKDAAQARKRAARLMASEQARGNSLISRAVSKLKRAKVQAATIIENGRRKGRELISKANRDLVSARKMEKSSLEGAKNRAAKLLEKPRRSLAQVKLNLMRPILRSYALQQVAQNAVNQMRIVMLFSSLRGVLSNPLRKGIGGRYVRRSSKSNKRTVKSTAKKTSTSKSRRVYKPASRSSVSAAQKRAEQRRQTSYKARSQVKAKSKPVKSASQSRANERRQSSYSQRSQANRNTAEAQRKEQMVRQAAQLKAKKEAEKKNAAAQASTDRWNAQVKMNNRQRALKAATERWNGQAKQTKVKQGIATTLETAKTSIQQPPSITSQATPVRRNTPTNGPAVFAGDLTDAQVRAQIAAAGGNPNIGIKQVRIIVHNSRQGALIRAKEEELKQQRSQQASAARWMGMAEGYQNQNKQRAAQTEAGRWTTIAEAYRRKRADQASTDRWEAQAEYYKKLRAAQAYAERWTAIAEAYLRSENNTLADWKQQDMAEVEKSILKPVDNIVPNLLGRLQQKAIESGRKSKTIRRLLVSSSKVFNGALYTNHQILKWINQHQVGVAVGAGVVGGLAAIALTGGLATPLVTAGWAAFGVGSVVSLGTVGLNTYFDRSLNYGVVRNVGTAMGAAISTTLIPTMYANFANSIGLSLRIGITWLPLVLDKINNPNVTKLANDVAYVLPKVVIPVVSGLFTGAMNFGVTTSIHGMSTNIDPTLASGEQSKGQELGLSGFAITAGTYYTGEFSKIINKLIWPFHSRPYDPYLGSTTLGQSEYLPSHVMDRKTNTLYGVPGYTWEGKNVPFVRDAYFNGDKIPLPTPRDAIDPYRSYGRELVLLNELYRKYGHIFGMPKVVDILGHPIEWSSISNLLYRLKMIE